MTTFAHTLLTDVAADSSDMLLLQRISKSCGLRIAVYRYNGSYYIAGQRIDSLRYMVSCMADQTKLMQFRLMWGHPFFTEYYGTGSKLLVIEDGIVSPATQTRKVPRHVATATKQ